MIWYDRYVQWRLGPAARLVYKAFDNPDHWDARDEYTVTHIPSSITFWVGNGASHFKVHRPRELNVFTGFERRVLFKRYKLWRIMFVFTRLAGLS